MILDYLWHSEFIAILKNSQWQDVTIISDTWLSDYIVGDLMWRNPTFDINYDVLTQIDAIFISHWHTDHLDPYTLVDLYKNLKNIPILLIPETLQFLKEVFETSLPLSKIIVMKNKEKYDINWVGIRWYIFENQSITNEDDVMSLFISNEKEIVYTEVDTIPPSNEETQNYLYKIFTEKNYESVVYLATRNELEGNLRLLDIVDISERKKFEKKYIESRREDIEYEYSKFEYGADFRDIYKIKNFMRIFIGQGIIYPKELNSEMTKLKLMTLEEEAKIERKISKNYHYHFPINYLKAGQRYEVIKGNLREFWTIPYIKDIDYLNPKADLDMNLTRPYASWPLNNERRNTEKQKKLILKLLNERFLPYQIGNIDDNFKHILLKSDAKKYVIAIKFGTKENFETVYYISDYRQVFFEEWITKNNYFDEDYWANDIDDFYNGSQELYSNFLHTLSTGKSYRFWTALWANFLNNDLIKNKFILHFERANTWKTARDFVLNYYNNL